MPRGSGAALILLAFAAAQVTFRQSVAALLFTSLGTIGREQGTGYRIAAFSSCVLCLLGALILSRYNEKRVMGILGEPVKK